MEPLSRTARFWQWWAALSLRRPWPIAAVAIALFLGALPAAIRLYGDLRTDLRELLPQGAPAAVALQELEKRIGGFSHLNIVVRTDDLGAGERFVDALGARLKELPPSLVAQVHWRVDAEKEFLDRHGALYAREYGYDEEFEALVAEIVARFVQRYDARRERCWIAERDGDVIGCVFLVKKSRTVAQLRLLLVEPAARGVGLGTRLVDECVRFARQAGYRTLVLWTQSALEAARRLYAAAGFRRTRAERHHSFGKSLVAEIWELVL